MRIQPSNFLHFEDVNLFLLSVRLFVGSFQFLSLRKLHGCNALKSKCVCLSGYHSFRKLRHYKGPLSYQVQGDGRLPRHANHPPPTQAAAAVVLAASCGASFAAASIFSTTHAVP